MRNYLPNLKAGVSKQDTALIIEEQIKHSLCEILCVGIYIHEIDIHTCIPIDMYKVVHTA